MTHGRSSGVGTVIYVRLPPVMLAEVDSVTWELRIATPCVRVTRSDAIRVLVREALEARATVGRGKGVR